MRSRFNKEIEEIRTTDFNYDAALANWNLILHEFQDSNDPQSNNVWAMISAIEVHQLYSLAFEQLKKANYYMAWCTLERAELVIAAIRRNDSEVYDAVKDISFQIQRVQSIYPYKAFASTEILIKEQKCSICDSVRSIRNDCGHRVGYVYNGNLCANIVTKAELKSVSIVTNPVHKYGVAFIKDEKGGTSDHYDYGILSAIIKVWESPYKFWDYQITTKDSHPHINFILGLKGV
jgi:hypothetical protein